MAIGQMLDAGRDKYLMPTGRPFAVNRGKRQVPAGKMFDVDKTASMPEE